tara:strand:+ start:860 stop:1045 length:186 start_codon:yes stop_codon:yes gene_type:complete
LAKAALALVGLSSVISFKTSSERNQLLPYYTFFSFHDLSLDISGFFNFTPDIKPYREKLHL